MSHFATFYPQPGKAKSRRVCEALAESFGGAISEGYDLQPGVAGFYGIVGLEPLWRAARRGEFIYADNAYFDAARGTHFRVTWNALQDEGKGPADWSRFNALGIEVEPWRRSGRHIVVVVQSEHFMREVAGWPVLDWQASVLKTLKKHTDRPIVVRHWSRDKLERARSLKQDLDGAWALVTHMSAAANEALLMGIPVFVTGKCSALAMGLSQLESIEYPRRPDGRETWAAALAARQWTLEELRDGKWLVRQSPHH